MGGAAQAKPDRTGRQILRKHSVEHHPPSENAPHHKGVGLADQDQFVIAISANAFEVRQLVRQHVGGKPVHLEPGMEAAALQDQAVTVDKTHPEAARLIEQLRDGRRQN